MLQSEDSVSRAAFHQAPHVFSLHCHWQGGEMWEAAAGGGGGETAFIGKGHKGVGF